MLDCLASSQKKLFVSVTGPYYLCLFEGKYESVEFDCFCVFSLLILVHLGRRGVVKIKADE